MTHHTVCMFCGDKGTMPIYSGAQSMYCWCPVGVRRRELHGVNKERKRNYMIGGAFTVCVLSAIFIAYLLLR